MKLLFGVLVITLALSGVFTLPGELKCFPRIIKF